MIQETLAGLPGPVPEGFHPISHWKFESGLQSVLLAQMGPATVLVVVMDWDTQGKCWMYRSRVRKDCGFLFNRDEAIRLGEFISKHL